MVAGNIVCTSTIPCEGHSAHTLYIVPFIHSSSTHRPTFRILRRYLLTQHCHRRAHISWWRWGIMWSVECEWNAVSVYQPRRHNNQPTAAVCTEYVRSTLRTAGTALAVSPQWKSRHDRAEPSDQDRNIGTASINKSNGEMRLGPHLWIGSLLACNFTVLDPRNPRSLNKNSA